MLDTVQQMRSYMNVTSRVRKVIRTILVGAHSDELELVALALQQATLAFNDRATLEDFVRSRDRADADVSAMIDLVLEEFRG